MPVFAFLGSTPDLLIIAFVILLLFGNRLPSVMRSLGEGVVEFKKGIQGIEDKKDEPAPTEKKPE